MKEIARNDHLYDAGILDDEDAALVHALQIAPRAKWSDLEPILGMHASTLAARWQRLRDSGIAWTTAHPISSRSNPVLAFVEVRCELGKRDELITRLSRGPEIVSIDIAARDRDLTLTVSTDSLASIAERMLPAIASHSGVEQLDISLATRMYAGGDAWRLRMLSKTDQQELRKLAVKVDSGKPRPRIDPRILHELAKDGRRTATGISRATGIHEVTVRRQIREAVSSGEVHLRCEVSQDVSGLPVTCQWYCWLPAADHDSAASKLYALPGMRLCVSTTGRANFFVVMWLSSVGSVLAVERQLMELVPTLEIRESVVALQIVKRVGWLLGGGGRPTGEVIPPRWCAYEPDASCV